VKQDAVLGVLGVAVLVVAACGGTTTQAPGSSGSSGSSGAGSSGSSGARACTELGCQNGVTVDFSYTQPGAYVFVVTIDGDITTCKAALPLAQQPPTACDRDAVLLGLVGSMLPAAQQSIGGLILPTTLTAKSVTVKATRDGTLVGEKTFVPPYVVTPSPNGPGCEPAECKLANVTFP
jgi:hypothetical protein